MVEVVHMDRMRKLIADHMVMSKQTSAHVTSFIEADVTNLMDWRNKEKDAFQKREGEKLTLTPLFVNATVKALKQYPMINSSVDGDKILVKKNINIGLAAALPNGNLIVPVIKDADKLSLVGLSAKVNDLVQRARENKLQPDEIQGGTFTITNLGMFETLTGTPIINQPQVAILAIGAITKRVVVIESATGDTIGIRQIAMLSLSYDHRVVDGALGGLFLKAVRDNLQNFAG
jgi:2-oxoglutarate dehydrogenase E2 component (dihydrolipoamide succinyltransferase)